MPPFLFRMLDLEPAQSIRILYMPVMTTDMTH